MTLDAAGLAALRHSLRSQPTPGEIEERPVKHTIYAAEQFCSAASIR